LQPPFHSGCFPYDMRFPVTLQLRGHRKRHFSIRLARYLGVCIVVEYRMER
jgi:hypothetical protein